ncbi:hypothetical protein GGS23DRAFT_285276 [Durotheca rogersii]|uniref:uncharacterized protein n=1 Tax=Durotheca rogersii TaxID=419775 RepID=UPI00221FC65E|nr:uncharacterized protein GGS23DRAFT_285276 [Durotheca rogersii]KAI5866737.1 hypothetical protein GGS23DRAFT_285276 [Durotheca rogersii]
MSQQDTSAKAEPLIEVIEKPEDIASGFNCVAEAFGRQARDAFWISMNPGWDTPDGRTLAAARMIEQWRATTTNKDGNPNTVFLKATVSDPDGRKVIAGIAIWGQLSVVEGCGDRPSDDLRSTLNLEALYPGNEPEQRYLCQFYRSFMKRRVEVVREKETSQPPSLMHLQLCAVDPAFQRRGIALKLVQWGLEEARRRGDLEATTEASIMGRHVYARLGFRGEGQDIEYEVDLQFKHRDRPANLFMRTGSH